MKRLLLVDSDDESVSALIVQLEFDREYIVESVAGYEELEKITKEKKIFDLILVNIQNITTTKFYQSQLRFQICWHPYRATSL